MEFGLTFPLLENFKSPNHETKPRETTKVIVLHGTRGGAKSLDDEFYATVRWFNDPHTALSAHAIWGVGKTYYPVPLNYVAWHAREYNKFSLGGEMVQPLPTDKIPDEVLIRAAKDVAIWCRLYNIPVRWDVDWGICEHKDIAPGIREGKTDISTLDRDRFIKLVKSFMPITAQRKAELTVLPEWYYGCLENNEDWTLKTREDFVNHLKGIGADYTKPEKYGWH